MLVALTVEQIRAAEADLMAGLPEGALMQRAASGLAHAVADFLAEHCRVGVYGSRILLLIGSGDNGGDALYAGAMLARRGAAVTACLLSERAHRGALVVFRATGGRIGDARGEWDVVVDGIVGIGGSGPLRPDAIAALDQVAGIPVVAVDLPSGVDADTGHIAGPHVEADLTVTFGWHRIAHLVDPGAGACGRVRLVDLGGPEPSSGGAVTLFSALEEDDVASLLVAPDDDAQKYNRGVVGVRAGSARYPGAAVLCVAGANTGLAGMVRYVGAGAEAVRVAHPEVVGDGRVQAWVVGSGTDTDAAEHLRSALADGVPVVVDADALTHASAVAGCHAVLTPHAGELAAMLDTSRDAVEAEPLRHARLAAAAYQAVVLLKGRRTVVVAPDGRRARVNTTGTPWLATAGSGDVLAGLIGSLLASGLEPFDAASAGAWLHGRAAELASQAGPITASAVAGQLQAAARGTLER
ncbi:MAG: bifunctional ADP-dependent NAD(P)H-hydrate dehydratase/NAD(P)H-hydrate epimerase [Nocardioides sp.]